MDENLVHVTTMFYSRHHGLVMRFGILYSEPCVAKQLILGVLKQEDDSVSRGLDLLESIFKIRTLVFGNEPCSWTFFHMVDRFY